MGKTAFSGPVYGAQHTLYAVRVDVSSGGGNGVSTEVGWTVVPVGQDWFVTDFQVMRMSTGSTGLGIGLYDDSSNVSSIVLNSSLANASSIAMIAPDGGEYAGARIAAGSTVTIRAIQSSVAPASSGVYVNVLGYVRYVASTRNAEVV